MAEALKTFREGEDILASETNENNQYLLSKLSDNAAQVQSYVEGEVATIKSNVASVQATLQNNIDELDAKKPIYVTEVIRDGNKWCRVYSDGWCEQGGETKIAASKTETIILLKEYVNANYGIFTTVKGNKITGLDGFYAMPKTKNSFDLIHDWANSHANNGVYWRTCGYLN